jgi:Heparinase II/III-like protein
VPARQSGQQAAAPPRAWSGWLAGLAAILFLAACTGPRTPAVRPSSVTPTRHVSTQPGATAPAASGSTRLSAAARACGTLPTFPAGTASEIMAGRLTIAPWPAVTIDPRRDGDIDWSLNPFHHPTWQQTYQSGSWIEALIERYLAGGPGADAYRARAKALLLGWLQLVPIQARASGTLICSSEAFPGQSWVTNAIPPMVNYQLAHWQGAWNHGLQQDLEVMSIGCSYPADAFGGQALRWRQTAHQQMLASFAPNRLGPAVDSQGVTNEQATGYANYNYGLWTRAERQLAACGYALPSWITARIALMPMFLAQATQPDGRLVQIGDTYVETPRTTPGTPAQYAGTQGAAGSPPAKRVAVYSAGYVFGRSGWGNAKTFGQQSFYSLRFGPGQQIHGHDDHMSLTYYARGRNLLVNAGHTGYETTPYRAYLISPEAGNVLIMPGVPFSTAAPTALTRQDIGPDDQFFEFADTAFGSHPRERSVYIDQEPDLVLALDRASGAPSYQQQWHLDPALTVTTVSRSYAVAAAPGTQLEIRQIPLPGQIIPRGSTRVVRGQTDPYQGWVSRQVLQRTPAPVITMTRSGPSTAMLSLIAPSAPGAAVTTAISQQPGGWDRLQVHIGSAYAAFRVSSDGDIEQSSMSPARRG